MPYYRDRLWNKREKEWAQRVEGESLKHKRGHNRGFGRCRGVAQQRERYSITWGTDAADAYPQSNGVPGRHEGGRAK